MLYWVCMLSVFLGISCNQVAHGESVKVLSRVKRGLPVDFDPNMIGEVINSEVDSGVYINCSAEKTSFNVTADFVTYLDNGPVYDFVFVDENGSIIEENCGSNMVNGGFEYCFDENFGQCASSVEEIGGYIYVNYTLCFAPANDTETTVTRSRAISIQLYCVFEASNTFTNAIVPQLQKKTLDPVVGEGRFDFSIDRFTNSSFSVLSEQDTVTVEDRVYVKISLNDDVENVTVQAITCWTTDTENPSTGTTYYVIENGCAAYDPDLEDANLVYGNYVGDTVTFSYTSFVWNDPNTINTQYIYLHCQVYVCSDHEPANNCTINPTDCSSVTTGGNARRRRSVEYGEIVSMGPLRVEDAPQTQCNKYEYGCAFDCYATGPNDASCYCPHGYHIAANGKSCQDSFVGANEAPAIVYVTNPKLYYLVMVLSFAWFVSIAFIASKIRSSKDKIILA